MAFNVGAQANSLRYKESTCSFLRSTGFALLSRHRILIMRIKRIIKLTVLVGAGLVLGAIAYQAIMYLRVARLRDQRRIREFSCASPAALGTRPRRSG